MPETWGHGAARREGSIEKTMLTLWALAGTFLGVEVNRMSSSIPVSHGSHPGHGWKSSDSSIELSPPGSAPKALHQRHEAPAPVAAATSTGELSGIYFGILNIYTTIPQFVGTGISWLVFSLLEPGKSPELAAAMHPDEQHANDGVSGIGVCLFIGAACALMAAWNTRKLQT